MINYSESSIIYVSQTEGNDSYSGLAKTFTGGNGGPLRSLTRAMELISGIRAAGLRQPLSVTLCGDYYLERGLAVGNTSQMHIYNPAQGINNITFEALPGTRVRMVGGRKLTGFSADECNGYPCVSLDVGTGIAFTSLYRENRYLPVARYPMNGTLTALKTENDTLAYGHTYGSKWIIAHTEDLADIEDIEGAGVSFFHWWLDEHTAVASYDRESGKLEFVARSEYTMTADYTGACSHADTYYYLENVRKGFGAPQSWYLDKKNGKLYYMPEEGEKPEDIVLYTPTQQAMVTVAGTPENKVSGIRFKNIDFFCSDGNWHCLGKDHSRFFPDEREFAASGQSHAAAIGAVKVRYAEMCQFESCRFSCLGFHALEIGKGCDTVRVENCEFFENGGSAIKVAGGRAEEAAEEATRSITIRKNYIHDNSRYYKAACGILFMNASHSEISDNEICRQDYTGISVGWMWGYRPSSTCYNIIQGNHVHHIGGGLLSDLGGIYTLGNQAGSVFEDNLIHHIDSKFYGAHAIHSDEGSSEILWENNTVYESKQNCFHLHYGTANVVRRNLFGFADQALIRTSRNEGATAVIFEDNDFITEDAPVFLYENASGIPTHMHNPSTVSHDNRLWDVARQGAPMMSRCGDVTVELPAWQAEYGVELNSTVACPADIEIGPRTVKKK